MFENENTARNRVNVNKERAWGMVMSVSFVTSWVWEKKVGASDRSWALDEMRVEVWILTFFRFRLCTIERILAENTGRASDRRFCKKSV